jgi:hypothetical protein
MQIASRAAEYGFAGTATNFVSGADIEVLLLRPRVF